MLIDLIYGVFLFISIFIITEVIIQKIVHDVRKNFPWLIISSDNLPILSEIGLKKFIPNGFDPELGWIRKPNTTNTEKNKNGEAFWSINSILTKCNSNMKVKKIHFVIDRTIKTRSFRKIIFKKCHFRSMVLT